MQIRFPSTRFVGDCGGAFPWVQVRPFKTMEDLSSCVIICWIAELHPFIKSPKPVTTGLKPLTTSPKPVTALFLLSYESPNPVRKSPKPVRKSPNPVRKSRKQV